MVVESDKEREHESNIQRERQNGISVTKRGTTWKKR